MKKPAKKKSNRKLSDISRQHDRRFCPVVGIGASAGGLAAFKIFFSAMPPDNGMAFVLVPHLDPTHQSLMVELLSSHTKMPVVEAQHDIAVEPDHVYIIPPGKYLAIHDDKLQLSKPPQSQKIETAIDHFLRSMAVDKQQCAIGIILSGTSSHGTLGLQAIKAQGGMTMVQTPDSAEYDSMPQNAIDSGTVDYILPPQEMPAALIQYIHHTYVSGTWSTLEPAVTDAEQLERILQLLRVHTQYDFRYYRKNMIRRRVQRRMSLNHLNQLGDYAELLSKKPQEAKQLFRDMLIGVTGFFREPEAYKVLEELVIPQWVQRKDSDTPVRIWIPGCATGEEAYSIAILLIEKFSSAQQPLKLQIFATDIDEVALDIARQGIYPVSIAADISAERLARFFLLTGSHYQVTKQVRESVVFAAQNLISDAPFSKLDMISCRNLLIYLESPLQQKVISLFHFALKPDAYLFLGSSETVGRHLDLFESVSKKWRVFRRIGLTRRDIVEFPITNLTERRSLLLPVVKSKSVHKNEVDFAELTRRQLLKDYAPASVLINRKYEVLYFQGATGDFLQAPTGEPTRDLIAMAREGLQTKLRAACYKAIHEDKPVSDNNARVKHNAAWLPCSIIVKPFIEPRQAEGLLLVTFHQREAVEPVIPGNDIESTIEESSLVSQLEYELKATRDDLQSSIEDMNSSNEELKASNEEIMSMNEELQSANEELETSKEELQSLNEELSTVNSQLQDKLEELDKAHNDMSNLLNSSDIATLFLGTDLTIRQFTPSTGKLLGLLNSDKGRPISTFATEFTGEDLLADAHRVLDKLTVLEQVISTGDGQHYIRRILPYLTADNRIDGLVVTFINMTKRFESDQQARRMATVLHDSNDAITVFDFDGNFSAWNRGAEQLYGYSEAEALTMNIKNIVPSDKQAETEKFIQSIIQGEQIKSFDSTRLSKAGHVLEVWITVTPLHDETGKAIAIATTERDVGERIQLDALRVQTDRLLSMVEHLPAGAVYREKEQLMLNQAAEQITGYTREELNTMDAWFNKLYGKNANKIRQQYQQELEIGFPIQTGPVALQHKNGEKRFVEYAAYRFDDHEVWILHDVTQRFNSETALRDREERLRAVMDNVAEAIVVIGKDGIITDFNNAAKVLFDYSAKETIGHNVSLLMPSPYREAHDAYLSHYLKTREAKIINKPRELPGRRKDGSIFPLQLTVTRVDHVDVFIGIMRDLSEQKLLERQIAEISTQEQERIGQEIHDGLGQQLTGLSMIASSVQRQLARKNFPEAELLNELNTQLQLAIKDARALSHGLVPVPITPEGLRDALIILTEDVNRKMGIKCHFEVHDSINIQDRTIATQIYRIVLEAVNNAVKHAQATKIDIYLDTRMDSFKFSVRDNGCGFLLDDNINTGAGLRIMRYRAGIIGGDLTIKSASGKGTLVRCQHMDKDLGDNSTSC